MQSDTMELKDWDNKDNINYYENIPIETFRSYAVAGGFENGCDIEIVKPYILKANSIAEIGAGYGRVLKNVLNLGFKGKLTAIERSQMLCDFLLKEYPQVHVINSDIANFNPVEKYDLILWMWSNISDFPKKHHIFILEHLSSFIQKDGYFILDTFSHTVKPNNATVAADQSYIVSDPHGTAYGYIPSIDEIHEYAEFLGYKNIQHIPYKTETDRPRTIHILSEKN